MLECFQPLNTPPYSCRLNSIERLWSYCKRGFRNILMEAASDIDREEFEQRLNAYLEAIPPARLAKFVSSNREALVEYLEEDGGSH